MQFMAGDFEFKLPTKHSALINYKIWLKHPVKPFICIRRQVHACV